MDDRTERTLVGFGHLIAQFAPGSRRYMKSMPREQQAPQWAPFPWLFLPKTTTALS